MMRRRALLLIALLVAAGGLHAAMPQPTSLAMNRAHGMAALTPPLAAASGPPLSQRLAAPGEGPWPRYARFTLMAQQAPSPSPTPTPAPAGEERSEAPFRPSEDVPADAEVDFPGDI
jgi:hypothetical protein